MADRSFEGKPVSEKWFALLTAARKAGVGFSVNSGRRTMGQQWELYRAYKAGRGSLAAFPNPNAPHIRMGRQDHAIDFEGSQAIINWAGKHSVNLRRTVSGESWHLEAQNGFLGTFTAGPRTLRGGARGKDVYRLVTNLMWLGFLPWPVLGRPRSYYGGWVSTGVAHFQRHYKLAVDGVAGEVTLKRVAEAVASRKRNRYKPRKRLPLLRNPKPPRPVERPVAKPRVVSLDVKVEDLFGPLGRPETLVVHHGGSARDRSDAEALDILRGYHQLHAGKEWGGIGYHFAVTTKGTLVRCRPVRLKGVHAPPNSGRIGVVLCGSYGTRDDPSGAQIRTLRWLYKNGTTVGVPRGLRLVGHRDVVSTSCPGDKLYAALNLIRG